MRDAYKRFLQQRGISPNEQFALQKWMRFFLDYCDKYNHKAKSRLSIPPFLQKLTSKKQKALQIRQAEKAIQLFLQCIQ
ncbi:hypothetical protein [Desulfosediminicola ganghwensis]|uniref:hypothetical protein n=1 Tax=Desulfosediminicola ganghwensis TaxID=2569540 RepID=UPI001592EB5C|nr:hypothetical protein [Desulfosediminicola ganghwensis]